MCGIANAERKKMHFTNAMNWNDIITLEIYHSHLFRYSNLTCLYAWRFGIPDRPHKSHVMICSASEAIELLLLEAPPLDGGLCVWSFIVVGGVAFRLVRFTMFVDGLFRTKFGAWCWTLNEGNGFFALFGAAGGCDMITWVSGEMFLWCGSGPLLWLWCPMKMWICSDFISRKVSEHCWHFWISLNMSDRRIASLDQYLQQRIVIFADYQARKSQ